MMSTNSLIYSPDRKFVGPRTGPVFALLGLMVFFIGLMGAEPTQAQNASSTAAANATSEMEVQTSIWKANFGAQAGRVLEKKEDSGREAMLQTLIRVAEWNPPVDLTGTLQPLLQILEADSNSQHRLMAIQALNKIGPEHVHEETYQRVMSQVAELMEDESSERVRRLAASCLKNFVAEDAA